MEGWNVEGRERGGWKGGVWKGGREEGGGWKEGGGRMNWCIELVYMCVHVYEQQTMWSGNISR